MLLDWSDEYSIGIGLIDNQHKEFFAAVHKFHDEVLTCKGEDAVEGVLNFLRDYAAAHFRAEEAFMRDHGYPGVDRHARVHEEFLEEYAEFAAELKQLGPNQDLADQTAEKVQSWLVEHIADFDTDYATHIKQRN